MNKSESIKELAPALIKAQSEMAQAHKKSNNPHFKSKYANLSEVLSCVKDAFLVNGISFTQLPTFENGIVCVETVFIHSSGEWVSSVSGTPIVKVTPQGVGDAITYLRRYSLAAMAGLGQEDDDGNSHSHKRAPSKLSVDIAAVASECGWTLEQVVESFKNPLVKSIRDIQDLGACEAYIRSNKPCM